MRRGRKEMFDEIDFVFLGCAFTGGHPDDSFAAAALGAESTNRSALDKAAMSNADDSALVGDQVFHVDLAFVGDKLSQARAAIFLLNLAQLFLDNLINAALPGQNV